MKAHDIETRERPRANIVFYTRVIGDPYHKVGVKRQGPHARRERVYLGTTSATHREHTSLLATLNTIAGNNWEFAMNLIDCAAATRCTTCKKPYEETDHVTGGYND